MFKLSAELKGHKSDVKAVKFADDTLISTSRDGTGRKWALSANPFAPSEWTSTTLYTSDRFVNATVYMQDLNAVAFAGQESVISIVSMKDGSQLALLPGHTANVCALDYRDGLLVSGSWDYTAKVWDTHQDIFTLSGHQAAVWAVLALPEGRFLTGSADSTIKLWKDGKCIKSVTAHSMPVRGLCRLPNNSIVSCSNDLTVKVWSPELDLVAELKGHKNFVYQVAALSTGELVSVGEDRSVRIWKDDKCIQTIVLPTVSVWTVDVNENDDIAVGSSDSVIRVFSRSPDRWASDDQLRQFDDAVASTGVSVQELGYIQKDKIPSSDALKTTSGTEGDTILVRDLTNVVSIHLWTNGEWKKIGEVVDAAVSEKKQLYEGKEYDYVFDVDIEDGKPPLKLPYNANDNPYTAAAQFLAKYELPSTYIEQTVQFILQNTQGSQLSMTGPTASSTAAPPTPAQATPAPVRSHGKILPIREYLTIEQGAIDTILKRVGEYNSGSSSPLPAEDLQALPSLARNVKNPMYSSALSAIAMEIVRNWPGKEKLPGLDLMRLAAPYIESEAIPIILDGILETEGCLSTEFPGNLMTSLRLIVNLFKSGGAVSILKKPTSTRILSAAKSAHEMIAPKAMPLTVATLYLNFAVAYIQSTKDGDIGTLIVQGLSDFVASLNQGDSEAVYRAAVAGGTMIAGTDLNTNKLKDQIISLSGDERLKAVVKELSSN
ncbi:hypothetical protein CANCADRAFT_74329 [Tortispora caseinolytica NRRL Y-17796]|uniref:PFU domain-containing protein n=1 Tax=Tortispora caseinolytica NRRL Y-17796 TaxID=767744 RepID=A0A1E4TIV7_9ASCO|nr:hypothetical protein CANCADRAFT_74329 [Tortispora caseinolytica NRRL Y-17796]